MKSIIFLPTLLFVVGCSDPRGNPEIAVRTITFHSQAISEDVYFLLYPPKQGEKPLPVLYLLNGRNALPEAWASGVNLQKAANDYEMIVVSIWGGSSGYVNSSSDTTKRYEDYVLEVVQIVDDNFPTRREPSGRGLCGISMGGFGALILASRHHDLFGSTSSLSGALNYGVQVTGTYEYDPVTHVEDFRGLRIKIDIGLSDNLLYYNRQFHEALTVAGIPHEYNEYPGGHNWDFWGARVQEHFRFHRESFNR